MSASVVRDEWMGTDMNANVKILKSHPLFSRLSARTLRRMTAHAERIKYPKGSYVYKEGDPGDALFIVLSGRCQSHMVFPDEPEHILRIYGPGDTFGERALLSGDRHWSGVRVITDSVLMRISADDVNPLLGRDSSFARQLAWRMRDQMRSYREEQVKMKLGRVVALVSMSPPVRGAVVSECLSHILQQETQSHVLAVHVRAGAGSPSLADWERARGDINGAFFFADAITRSEDGLHRLNLFDPPGERSLPDIATLIGHFARHFRYVIVHLDPDVQEPASLEFLVQSDIACALMSQVPEDLYRTNLLIRQVRAQPAGQIGEIWPLLCLAEHERAHPYAVLNEQIGSPVHGVIHGVPGAGARDTPADLLAERPRLRAHIRLLAREIGRCRIGLALSSGGAKGLAHIGVIQVLEENDIPVDVVAGSSMGAYVGALWAYGIDGKTMAELAAKTSSRWALMRLIDPVLPPRKGFMRGVRMRHLLEASIGDAHFSDLIRGLRVVATDLDTLERVVFESGRISEAVHASMAMPGVIVPVTHNERTLIDGGIADPLPVDLLMEMGVERIIAVNTIPNPDELRYCALLDREHGDVPDRYRHLIPHMSRYVNYFARGNILDILIRSIHGAATRVAEGACKQADVVLRPVSCDGVWHDFKRPEKYIEIGRQVAEEQLKELKELVESPLRRTDHETAMAESATG